MKVILICFFVIVCFPSYSQKQIVFFTDIIDEAIHTRKDEIKFSNVELSMDNLIDGQSLNSFLNSKFQNLAKDDSGRIVINSKVILQDVTTNSESKLFIIDSLAFRGGLVINGQIDEIKISKNHISNLSLGLSGDYGLIVLESNKISGLDSWTDGYKHFIIIGNRIQKSFFIIANSDLPEFISNEFEGHADINFRNCKDALLTENKSQSVLEISGTLENMDVTRNELDTLSFSYAKIQERFTCLNNTIYRFGYSKSLLPEYFVEFDWKQIAGGKIFLNVDGTKEENYNLGICTACIPYSGLTDGEMAREDRFLQLISVYTKFHRLYKELGHIDAANGSYSELQEFYTLRYNYLFRTEGGLKNWFKWRLNQLLKVYVAYGTDPSRALVISFYLIMAFAVFYFFFPSEWDKPSKKELFSRYRSAISKHEKGTILSLSMILWLLVLSFFNAFTLSVNAFVTLGFGEIPTKGLARYFCILQGFLGWFLLSIFSVALINQVIF